MIFTNLLQIILAISSYGKIITLILAYGLQGVGAASYITTVVTLFSILAQIINNQGVAVSYMKADKHITASYDNAIRTISLYFTLASITSLFILIEGGFINLSYRLMPIVFLGIVCSVKCGFYDFKSTVTGSVNSIISAQIVGSLAFFIYIIGIWKLHLDLDYVSAAYPIQQIFTFLYYSLKPKKMSAQIRKKEKTFDVKIYLNLQYKHLMINLIPITSIVSDYTIKTIFINYSGLRVVGLYQIIQSIDALIGNIFAGPVYKKALYYYSINKFRAWVNPFPIYVWCLLWPALSLLGSLIFLHLIDYPNSFPYYDKFQILKSYIYIFVGFIFFKKLTLLWGLIGQILLSLNMGFYVVCGEVGFRIALTIMTSIFFIFITQNIYSYILSYSIASIFLLIYGKYTLTRSIRQNV